MYIVPLTVSFSMEVSAASGTGPCCEGIADQKKYLQSGSSKMYGINLVKSLAEFNTCVCSFCVRHEESAVRINQ